MALHLRDKEMSLRDIAKRLVITTGAKKGQHPSAPHRHADAALTRRAGHHGSEHVITSLLAAGVWARVPRPTNGSSWSGPAPSARNRSRPPRRARSVDSCCACQGSASSVISLASLRRGMPVQRRCDKAVRAHRDFTLKIVLRGFLIEADPQAAVTSMDSCHLRVSRSRALVKGCSDD